MTEPNEPTPTKGSKHELRMRLNDAFWERMRLAGDYVAKYGNLGDEVELARCQLHDLADMILSSYEEPL